MSANISTYLVRAAANLAASATATTLWVPCKGASMLVFRWKATAGSAASQTAEGTNKTPPGTLALSASGAQLFSSTSSTAIAPIGEIRQLVVPLIGATQPAARFISVEYVRALLVNTAASLDNLECTAEVWYEDGALAPTGTVALAGV